MFTLKPVTFTLNPDTDTHTMDTSPSHFSSLPLFLSSSLPLFLLSCRACNDRRIKKESDCRGWFDLTLKNGSTVEGVQRLWVPLLPSAPYSFDDVWSSMLTLFEVASLELYLDVMYV